MLYQWKAQAIVNGWPLDVFVLAETEEGAWQAYEYELKEGQDFEKVSMEKTGLVLVHESELKGR